MCATQLRSNFLDFFTESKLPALEAVIQAKLESYPSMIPLLFNQENMNSDITQTTTMSGLRNPTVKAENAPVNFQTMQPGYSKTFTASTWATAYRISREMVRDGKINMIQKATESFAKGFFEVKELQAADILNDGFSTTQYDGTTLFSTSHPLENGGGQVGVNRPSAASALSVTSFRQLRNIMQDTVNENGQLVKYNPVHLVVPQALQDVAMEIVKSQYNPDNANNAINTLYDTVSVIPGGFWNYLSSDTAFFLFANKADHGLMFYTREAFETDSDYDKRAFAYEVIASERFTSGVAGWRGVVGNAGL